MYIGIATMIVVVTFNISIPEIVLDEWAGLMHALLVVLVKNEINKSRII